MLRNLRPFSSSTLNDKSRNLIKNILYGTKSQGDQATSPNQSYLSLPRPDAAETSNDDDSARSTHSLILSRGKYVHELQTHDVIPQHVEAYKELLANHYPRLVTASGNKLKLFGSWETTVGNLDQFST